MDRRLFCAALVAVSATPLLSSSALAAQHADYSDEAFEAAKAAGRPILIDVWASWCPTCKAQGFVFDELLKEPKYDNLLVLRVDFDNQGKIVRSFKAPGQSTLIVYKGADETGRSVGDANPNSIRTLIDSAY